MMVTKWTWRDLRERCANGAAFPPHATRLLKVVLHLRDKRQRVYRFRPNVLIPPCVSTGRVGTVGKELGHGGEALVKRVYGHLGTVRHRAEVVEHLVDQHKEQLGARLKLLKAG